MIATLIHDTLTCLALAGVGADRASDVTYAKHIAPILYQNCVSCHRPGQAGPFSLLSYADARGHSDTIRSVVHERYMPPWKAAAPVDAFVGERRLTDEQVRLIATWVDAGCPEGNASDLPPRPTFSDGWALGTPDLVVKMSAPFEIPAEGGDVYRSFVLPAGLGDDKWVKAIELHPKAKSAVHHALFFIDSTGAARELDGADGKPGIGGMGFLGGGRGSGAGALLKNALQKGGVRGQFAGIMGLGGYVPGTTPQRLPADLALPLPKGSDIVMQTHFHPSGKPEVEQAELALYFADRPPSKMLAPIQVPPLFGIGKAIDIPAGERAYTVADSFTLPIEVDAYIVGGHAHYICRRMSLTAKLPDGSERVLLRIDDWDLDWQDRYTYRDPVRLPAGTVLSATLIYDNSSDNPENPHSPPQRIRWGRQSTDEMGSIGLTVVAVDEHQRPTLQAALRRHTLEALTGRRTNRD